MALTGKQKAAMLLMGLDITTATEMLKGLDQRIVQDLAVELTYLNAAGLSGGRQSEEITRQFCSNLKNRPKFHLENFLSEMLKSTVGEEKARAIQTQIQDLLQQRDPFISIRSADLNMLAAILENEHPQAVAVVLSELPPKSSSEILGLLGEGVRLSAISRMTNVENITVEAKARIADTIRKRIESLAAEQKSSQVQVRPEQSLRKVAMILRNLGKELRDGLLGAIREKDGQAGEQVTNLMIVWEDIVQISDRSIQEALRGINERSLALALYKSDEAIVQKIRANISERAAAMVDEEASLMSTPKKEEIQEARGKIIDALREKNSKGELTFLEE
jgi:flagellar motor switch protein FliG